MPGNGPRIGRYEIEGEAGRGAMGVVHRALDPAIGRRVAVKTIRLSDFPSAKERDQLRASLAREARSAGMLQHPNIVTVYDYGEENDIAFLAMEYVPGLTLDHVLSTDGMLDKRRIPPVLEQVASALDYAHAKGVVHRDVKPGNVMFDERGMAKVTDFGVAKMTSHEATQSGLVMGTPSYMSPEQIDAKPVDGRSDQFALAVIAYELLTGERPFTADSMAQLVFRIAREAHAGPSRLNPSLGPDVDAVFERALAKEPRRRYESCAAFVADLLGALRTADWNPLPRNSADSMPTVAGARTTAPVSAPAPSMTKKSALDAVPAVSPRVRREEDNGRPWWTWAAAAAVLLGVAGAAFVWKQPKPEPEPAQPVREAVIEPIRIDGPPVDPPRPPEVKPPPKAEAKQETKAAQPKGRGLTEARPVNTEPDPESAVVVFTSVPSGAKVTMDRSREFCTTPCELELAQGPHVLKFNLPGYRTYQAIIESPRDTLVHAPLDMIAGTLAIKSTPAGSKIIVDGVVRAEVTPAMFKLAAGRHRIVLSRSGSPDHTQDIEIKDQVLTNIEINWQP